MMGLDDGILAHPKFRRAVVLAGSEALHLWLGLRAYCSQQLTDGLVPEDMLRFVDGPEKPRARVNSLAALRAVGLVHDAVERAACETCRSAAHEGSGLWLHDYLQHSESRERALQRRANNRDRQRQLRAVSQRDSTGDEPDTKRHQANPSQDPIQARPKNAQARDHDRSVAVFDPLMNPEETVMPEGLRQRALEPDNAVDHLTKTLKVPRAVIVAELEDFCRYREAGLGMGDKRAYWLKHFRQQVLNRAKRNELKPIGAVEHDANREARPPRKIKTLSEIEQEALDARS